MLAETCTGPVRVVRVTRIGIATVSVMKVGWFLITLILIKFHEVIFSTSSFPTLCLTVFQTNVRKLFFLVQP